jgi:cell wall-associated NlpC family hydrolase
MPVTLHTLSCTKLSWRQVTALMIAMLTVATLTVAVAAPADAAGHRPRKISNALGVARHQKGDPYRWGAEGPRRFDCSGLTLFAYERAGLELPRTSREQARYARRIRRPQLREGDLIFFYKRRTHKRRSVYHVGIYAGWNRSHTRRRVVHAPRPGRRVSTEQVWTSSWFPATLRRRR